MQTSRHPFIQLDVFSAKPFEGNSLAVYPDGRKFTDRQMQQIAKEMNLSETTFVLPRDPSIEKERGIHVRIFTVEEELPFAGHPTLGTAFFLRGNTGAKELTLELKVGKIKVRFEDVAGEPSFGEMTQADPEFGAQHDREEVVRLSGLRYGDVDPSLPIETVSTGVPFTIVPLRGLEVIQRLQVDVRGSKEYLEKSGGKFFYYVTRETMDRNAKLHARMLFYNGEDPATGSAAGCAAAWMVAHGVIAPEEQALIEQGVEMGRPSRIFVRGSRRDNRVVNVRVGGNAVEIARGEIFF